MYHHPKKITDERIRNAISFVSISIDILTFSDGKISDIFQTRPLIIDPRENAGHAEIMEHADWLTILGQQARFPEPEHRRRIRGRGAAARVQQIVPAPPTPAQIPAERATAFWPARVTAAVPDFPTRCIP